MPVATHPDPETLAAFASGGLPPGDPAAVAGHVAGCAECRAAVARLPEAPPADQARPAPPVPAAPPAPLTVPDPPRANAPGVPESLADHPRYRILGELGAGGMGTVYKAEHRVMGRVVALKVVSPHLTAKSSAVERFRKEIQAAARLLHPNIVTAHDADEADGLHFLVMEYVEGTSLDRLVAKRGPLPVPMAAQFARQAALGLQHAHEKGMVHRDVKPQNLMATRKAQIKILDFGLARFAHAGEEPERPPGRLPFGAGKPVVDDATNPNLLMGTPDYLSPEQGTNSHAVDTRSDVYSLGCTLYFLLTGRPPFAGAPTLIDKLLAHRQDAPAPVRGRRPEVPEGLAAVLDRMLAKNPADRYALPADAAAALLPFTRFADAPEGRAVPAYEVVDPIVSTPAPAGTLSPAAITLGTEPVPDGPTLVEAQKPRKGRRRKPVPWWKRKWVAAAVVLFLAGAAAIGAGKKKAGPPADPPPAATVTPAPPKPNPWQAAGKPVKDLKVLYVLPSDRLRLNDYLPVRERLEARGVKVVTACGGGDRAEVLRGGDPKGSRHESVKVDLKLAPDMDLADYAAVVFCGAGVDEYVGFRPTSSAAGRVIHRAKDSGKVLAGICLGEKVLAAHGALKGKKASFHGEVSPHVPSLATLGPITWQHEPVVTDGRVITASDWRQSAPFADALLAAIGAD